jgi:hypothetical protein
LETATAILNLQRFEIAVERLNHSQHRRFASINRSQSSIEFPISLDGYADFFLKLLPDQVFHRRYEVLRAVFVEGDPLPEVAQRLGVSYGSVRNWVSEFLRSQGIGQTPPFWFLPAEDDLPWRHLALALSVTNNHRLKCPPPMSNPCH